MSKMLLLSEFRCLRSHHCTVSLRFVCCALFLFFIPSFMTVLDGLSYWHCWQASYRHVRKTTNVTRIRTSKKRGRATIEKETRNEKTQSNEWVTIQPKQNQHTLKANNEHDYHITLLIIWWPRERRHPDHQKRPSIKATSIHLIMLHINWNASHCRIWQSALTPSSAVLPFFLVLCTKLCQYEPLRHSVNRYEVFSPRSRSTSSFSLTWHVCLHIAVPW